MNKYREEQLAKIKSNLEKYTRKTDTIAIQYYIPDTDEWVYRFNKNVVKRTGYTQRHWYNKFILEIDDPNYYPKCFKEGCNNKVRAFKGITYGYPMYCCLKHSRDDEDTKPERSISVSKAMNRPEVKTKRSESLRKVKSTKEARDAQSFRSKKMWSDPKFYNENVLKIPRPHGSKSKISREFFNELKDLIRLFGVGGNLYYGDTEYRVPVFNTITKKNSYRSLDFYSDGLNLIIEFMGTYYHPRREDKYSLDEINDSVTRDSIRMKEVYDTLSKRYPRGKLYFINVYEGEYRNKELKECLMKMFRDMFESYLITGDLSSSGHARLINLDEFYKYSNQVI